MFERSIIDMSNEWYDVSLGDIAESLVFYDQIQIRAPGGRILDLLATLLYHDNNFRSLSLFLDLIVDEKIVLIVDNFPPGEVALQAQIILPKISLAMLENDSVSPNLLGLECESSKPETKDNFIHLALSQMWANYEELMKVVSDKVEKILSYVRCEAVDVYTEDRMTRLIETMNMVNTNDNIGPECVSFLRDFFVCFNGYSDHKFQELMSKTSIKVVDILGYECRAIAFDSIGAGELIPAINHFQHIIDIGHNRIPIEDRYQSTMTKSLLVNQYQRSIRAGTNVDDCRVFQEIVVPGQRIADQINSGSKSFYDIGELIISRERFARTIRNKPSDESLAEWYFNEISSGILTKNSEQRLLRWGTFTAPGVLLDAFTTGGVGTAVGLTLSALDSLILDRCRENSGASIFVNSQLKPFLSGK